GTSRARSIPSATRSNVNHAPSATRRAAKAKIDSRRKPPSAQPISAITQANAATSSQSLRRFRSATSTRRAVVRVARAVALPVIEQAARWPVLVLRRVAAARAMKRRDVLERDEDVPIQFDMRDLVDVAVRGEDALLVLAAEKRDLDLLALVLARVVL